METDRTNARVDRPRPHARGHLGGRGFGRRRQNPPSSRQSEDINDGADGPVSLERLPTVNGHDGLATALSFYRRLLIQTEIEAAEDVRLPGDTTFDDVTGIVVGSDDIDSHASDEGVAVAAELLDETIQRRSPNLERHHRVVGGPTERDAEAGLPDESSFTTIETVDVGSEDPPVEHRLVAASSARALRRAVDWSQDRDPNGQSTRVRDLDEQTI